MGEGYGGFGEGQQRPGPYQGHGTSPMCASVEPLLYGFRTRTLERAQMIMVAEHVATCQHCSALVRQLDSGMRVPQAAPREAAGAAHLGGVASWGQSPDTYDAHASYGSPLGRGVDPYSEQLGSGNSGFGQGQNVPRWPPPGGRQWGTAGARKERPEFLRPPLVYYTGGAALCALLALTFIIISLPVLFAPSKTTATGTTSTVTSKVTATVGTPPVFSLPVFSDWRAAYIAADGKVHIAALDGSSNITGPALSLNAGDTRGGIGNYQGGSVLFQAAAVSPDGHTLAYVNQPPQPAGAGIAQPNGPIELVPLAGGGADHAVNASANDVYWSPDGQYIAFDGTVNGQVGVYVAEARTGRVSTIPQTQSPSPLSYSHVIGWIDSNHLAVVNSQGSSLFSPLPTATAAPTATATAVTTPAVTPSPSGTTSRDVPGGASVASTGAQDLAAHVPGSSDGNSVLTLNISSGQANLLVGMDPGALFSLSPDGTTLLASSNGGCAPGPCPGPTGGNAALVNTTTGQMQVLQTSVALLPPVGSFYWSPDSLSVAQTIPSKPSDPSGWLVNVVDLEGASGVTLRTEAFALGWSPDGKSIIVADSAGVTQGQAQAQAIQAASPSSTPATLPGKVTDFLGFVKTA
jgi:WD40-like Beta Propeller Repeat